MKQKGIGYYIKNWYEYYLHTVNSKDFENFCSEDERQSNELYLQSIKDDATLSRHTDFQSDSTIVQLSICDMLDNKNFTKLINHIWSLSPKRYKVECKYKKSTAYKKYDYIHLNYNGSGYGFLAKIQFLEDPYVSSIEILSSQLNNYFAVIEYIFYFKTDMDDYSCNDFICLNIPKLNKNDYRPFYICDNDKQGNYRLLLQARNELFPIICQHYITSLLHSDNGCRKKLPSLSFFTREAPFNIDTFAGTQFGRLFYNKKDNFVVEGNFDENTFNLFAGDNKLPHLRVSKLISQYGNNFYYVFLGEQFLHDFEIIYSKDVSRKRIKNKQFSNLLKLYYGLSDVNLFDNRKDMIKNFNEKWVMCSGYNKIPFEPESLQLSEKFKSIFHDMYEHYKAQMDIRVNQTGRVISYCALAISVSSVILSIILHFC